MTMRKLIALALIAALALGCGGAASLAGGGIGGSGLSSGALTRFGSIFVTGTEYDTNAASVTLERVASPASALRLGMVVVVEGDRSGATGTADSVTYDDAIEGPITAITVVSIDEKQLATLGQVVTIERTLTQFDASGAIVAPDFDSIAVGDLVEVSGFRREADIQATYLQKKGVAGGTPHVELKGNVSGVSGRSFMLGTILVNWSNATTLADLPGGGPTNGDFVEVEGALTNATTVQADRIERERAFSGDRDDFEIEGTVTQFASLASFRVDGQLVNASGAGVQFEPNNPLLVRNGVRVEVEGQLVNGALIATKVKQRDGEARVHAQIAAAGDIDAVARTVRLLGITIRADASTQFEDDLLGVPDLDIADLAAGDFLEVRGVEDGSGGIVATEIERADGVDDVRLRGSVTAIDAIPAGGRSVSILGALVPTDANTEFSGFSGSVSDEDGFYAAVQVGDLLDAEDREDGDETAIDVADEIEFEEP
jgi:hypothetical protein